MRTSHLVVLAVVLCACACDAATVSSMRKRTVETRNRHLRHAVTRGQVQVHARAPPGLQRIIAEGVQGACNTAATKVFEILTGQRIGPAVDNLLQANQRTIAIRRSASFIHRSANII
jgi:hypothetical protein